MGQYSDITKKYVSKIKSLTEATTPMSNEVMCPAVELGLDDNKLDHPAFPKHEDVGFIKKIANERFADATNNIKRYFDISSIDNESINMSLALLIGESIAIEKNHKEDLEKLAVEAVNKAFNIPDGYLDIEPTLVLAVNEPTKQNNSNPCDDSMQYDSYENAEYLKSHVQKRQLVNSLVEGAAKKMMYVFNEMANELAKLNPRLPLIYGKLMSASDYGYWIQNEFDSYIDAGSFKISFKDNKPKITAEGITFPALVYEITKGAMELLSIKGLPKNKTYRNYVLNKTNPKEFSYWNSRLSPQLWEYFISSMGEEHYSIKHHIYNEVVRMEPTEFHDLMREIFAKTDKGKSKIKEIGDNILSEMEYDEYKEQSI